MAILRKLKAYFYSRKKKCQKYVVVFTNFKFFIFKWKCVLSINDSETTLKMVNLTTQP